MKNLPSKTPRCNRPSSRTALALAALLPVVAVAAPSSLTSVTLEEALAIATERNPDLLASRASAEAAGFDAAAVRRSLRPTLRLDANAFASNAPANVFGARLASGAIVASDFDPNLLNDPDPLGHGTATLSLLQPVDISGRIHLQAEAAARQADAEGARADEAKLSIRFQVVSAFYRTLLAKRAVLVQNAALRSAKALAGDIASRREAGAALKADLLRTRGLVRQREADLLEAESRRDTLLLNFNALLDGRDRYEPADRTREKPNRLPELSPLLDHELRAHPLVVAAEKQVEAAQMALKTEQRTYRPTLALFGSLDEEMGPDSDFSGTVGFNLAIPLFDPGASRRREAAMRRLSAAEAALRSARSRVRLAIESAYRRAKVARSRLEAAKGGAEEAAEALRVVHERRVAGLATLTDELETESASLAAKLRELSTGIQVAIQDAALARAAGTL